MTIVYYSLICDPDGTHERQWQRSVESLRLYNKDVDVVLCLYGTNTRPQTIETLNRFDVQLCDMGEYSSALGDLPLYLRAAVSSYPTVHKFLSLHRIIGRGSGPVIYLDCDTYFFGDVDALAESYSDCDWNAREEPKSRRSQEGYDPLYLDEDALSLIASGQGLRQVCPYNTGVVCLSHWLASELVALRETYIGFVWRLLLGACLWAPQLLDDSWLLSLLLENATRSDREMAIPFPSTNLWILDEIATWLTLGRVSALSHSTFDKADVAQGSECFVAGRAPSTVAHYFTAGEEAFFGRLAFFSPLATTVRTSYEDRLRTR